MYPQALPEIFLVSRTSPDLDIKKVKRVIVTTRYLNSAACYASRKKEKKQFPESDPIPYPFHATMTVT